MENKQGQTFADMTARLSFRALIKVNQVLHKERLGAPHFEHVEQDFDQIAIRSSGGEFITLVRCYD
jgi:hypothetical protein